MGNIISLFSGIGGLDIAVEAATGLRVGLQVEADPFCRDVLAKHWPDAELHDDVRTIDWTGRKADLLIGGFPRPDVSLANPNPQGLNGPRSRLWFEMLRAIEEVSPTYVFIENVVGLRKRGLLTVLKGLRTAGYDAVWSPLSAKQVGAPHVRNRMWILAAKSGCFQSFDAHAPFGGTPSSAWLRGNGQVQPWERGTRRTTEAGNPTRKPRLKALGNAVVPECARQAFLGLNSKLLQLPPKSVLRVSGADRLEDLVEVPMSGFMSGVFVGKTSRLRVWLNEPKKQKSGDGLATAVLKAKDCGPLNPSWVELLMGFDLGHTEVQS